MWGVESSILLGANIHPTTFQALRILLVGSRPAVDVREDVRKVSVLLANVRRGVHRDHVAVADQPGALEPKVDAG